MTVGTFLYYTITIIIWLLAAEDASANLYIRL